MNRSLRIPIRSQANPTIHSRRKVVRRSASTSMLEITIIAFLGSMFVLMCGIYYYHFTSLNVPKPIPVHTENKQSMENLDFLPPLEPRKALPQRDGLNKLIDQLQNAKEGSLQHARKAAPPLKDFNNLMQQLKNPLDEDSPPHLSPPLPLLPVFSSIPDSDRLIAETLQGKPTIAGIVALLQSFISEFRDLNIVLSTQKPKPQPQKIVRKFFKLVEKSLLPFDQVYRGQTIFPVRDDGSIFMSLASFREHLLKETLVGAFSNAKSPDKLFIGAVVQNCFGRVDDDGTIHTDGTPCKTGLEVTGKDENGRDTTTVSAAPPDKNGIEDFCADPDFSKYCKSGQIRVVYVHEQESIGPAMARYYASKLWGGETYFVQTDSHLQFAEQWDEKYIAEVKATSNYPKSVLSTYPSDLQNKVVEHNGARLCSCTFSSNAIEKQIIRINNGTPYNGSEKRPKQIPFIAAGFFFAHGDFLRDVPFDPLMPWCFMGEEIALSIRAWTSGWDIYAPRKNLINHQYRPGRMGLPKFWEGVNRLYRGSGGNNSLQGKVIQRVKHMIGYADSSTEIMTENNELFILKEQEHYAMGNVRTLDEYMDWTGIDMENKYCPRIAWCNNGELD